MGHEIYRPTPRRAGPSPPGPQGPMSMSPSRTPVPGPGPLHSVVSVVGGTSARSHIVSPQLQQQSNTNQYNGINYCQFSLSLNNATNCKIIFVKNKIFDSLSLIVWTPCVIVECQHLQSADTVHMRLGPGIHQDTFPSTRDRIMSRQDRGSQTLLQHVWLPSVEDRVPTWAEVLQSLWTEVLHWKILLLDEVLQDWSRPWSLVIVSTLMVPQDRVQPRLETPWPSWRLQSHPVEVLLVLDLRSGAASDPEILSQEHSSFPREMFPWRAASPVWDYPAQILPPPTNMWPTCWLIRSVSPVCPRTPYLLTIVHNSRPRVLVTSHWHPQLDTISIFQCQHMTVFLKIIFRYIFIQRIHSFRRSFISKSALISFLKRI